MLVHTPPHPAKEGEGCVQGYILYYYYSEKKRGQNDITSGHVTDVTSGHVTSDVISGEVISDDLTSGRKKESVMKMNIFRKTTGKWYAENDVMYAENK